MNRSSPVACTTKRGVSPVETQRERERERERCRMREVETVEAGYVSLSVESEMNSKCPDMVYSL